MTDQNKALLEELKIERNKRIQAEKRLEKHAMSIVDTKMRSKATELQLHNAIQSMSDGFLLHDPDLNIEMANDQLYKIYYKGNSDKAIPEELLGIMKHKSYPGNHNSGIVDCAFETTLKSGRTVIVKAHKTLDGHIVSIHHDITHKRAFEIEQLRLLKELYRAQKLEAIGRMTGVIAHDFNNIIAAILGYSGFLEEDLKDSAELQTYAQRITESAHRGSDIIKNILDFGRKNDLPHTAIDINKIVKEAISIVTPTLKDIELKSVISEEKVLLDANNAQITQLIMNMVTNARDALNETNKMQKRIHLTTEALDSYDLNDKSTEYLPRFFANSPFHNIKKGIFEFATSCLRITITDNGSGMSKEIMQNVFEPFFSTKKHDQGTGLGLFGVSGIIAEHGGGLKIYSAEGTGTHCIIILPLSADSISTTKAFSRPVKVQTTGTIMVIDDEPAVGLMLAETLTRNAIPALYYEDAKSALAALKADPSIWRAIICDQMMPTVKGLDVFKSVRKIRKDLLFILCSGNELELDQEALLEMNAMFLRKPIDKNHLLAIIDQ